LKPPCFFFMSPGLCPGDTKKKHRGFKSSPLKLSLAPAAALAVIL
jgi:hypothetical protein